MACGMDRQHVLTASITLCFGYLLTDPTYDFTQVWTALLTGAAWMFDFQEWRYNRRRVSSG